MNRSTMHRFALFTSAALLVSSLPLAAQTAVPGLMTYQAFVTDDSNQPLAAAGPANFEVIFRVYDSATGNTVIWAEKQTVTIFEGNFSVLLGKGQVVGAEPKPDLDTIFTAKERYIGITVGENAEFTPRQRIVPNAYAYRAKVAESVDGVISADGGLTLGGTAVTASAAELNYLDIAHKGAVAANKGVVVNEHKDAKGFRNLQASYLDAVTLLARQNLVVNGNADLNGRLDVDGNSLFKGHVEFRNHLYVGGDGNGVIARIFGNTVGSYLNWNPVHNELQLMGTAKMYINNSLRVDGASDFNGSLDVDGYTHLDGLRSDGNIIVIPSEHNRALHVHYSQPGVQFDCNVLYQSLQRLSDERLKKNIQNLEDGALDKLLKLRPVTFEFKKPKFPVGKQTGFIAQDVEKVFPDWVSPGSKLDEEGSIEYKGLSMEAFPAFSVQALRELRAEKDAQIDALKEANSALETRLDRLEALLEERAN